jgi:tRNA pseudouridine38-40 synthase
MRVLKITLAYDGTRFVGWQRQAEGESIQGRLEEALARFDGAPVTVHGAGRTDAGVHALGQVASAVVRTTQDAGAVRRGLNATLPEDIRVLRVDEAPPDFHARFSARSKTYRYVIHHTPIASPFDRAFSWHLTGPLNLEAMGQAAAMLSGTHDFAAFRSVGGEVDTTVRTITRSEIQQRVGRTMSGPPSEPDQARSTIVYEVAADGFLRHMVRAIAGTLVEIGRGWREPSTIEVLLAGGRRGDAGATAPPHGLFLVRVDYDLAV